MQALETIIQDDRNNKLSDLKNFLSVPGRLTALLFGCWHLKMSRPFTRNSETYRSCLECGARRKFNLESWKMHGPYYFNAPELGLYQGKREMN